jgi:hypothetical protein
MLRLGLPEVIIIFCLVLLLFGPGMTERSVQYLATTLEEFASLMRGARQRQPLRFHRPVPTFNKRFFVALTIILALFTIAELGLLGYLG